MWRNVRHIWNLRLVLVQPWTGGLATQWNENTPLKCFFGISIFYQIPWIVNWIGIKEVSWFTLARKCLLLWWFSKRIRQSKAEIKTTTWKKRAKNYFLRYHLMTMMVYSVLCGIWILVPKILVDIGNYICSRHSVASHMSNCQSYWRNSQNTLG